MDPEFSLQDVVRCHLCETPCPPLYCDICKLHLCKACAGEHISDLSKEHKVDTFDKHKFIYNYPKCLKHSSKLCELHCEQCDIPICIHCISSGEHKGHNSVSVLDSFKAKKEVIERDLRDLEENVHPEYQNIASKIPIQRAKWNENSQKLTKTIDTQGEDFHKEIETIIQKIKSENNEIDTKHMTILNEKEDEIKFKISEIEQSIADVKKLKDSNDVSLVSEYKSRNDEFKRLPTKLTCPLPSFIPQKINTEQLFQQFGSLSSSNIKTEEQIYARDSPCAEFSSPKPLTDRPWIISEIKTEYNSLHSVSCLSYEDIWTCGNGNIMRLYKMRGELDCSIQTKSGNSPQDIAVTRTGDLVYTDRENRTVSIVKNTQVNTLIKLHGWIPCGVCSTSSGDLLVVMDSDDKDNKTKVVRYSGSKEIQSIQYNDEGKPPYSTGIHYKYISENRNLDICVSDNKTNKVVVFNQAGKLRFTYSGPPSTTKRLFLDPYGITTDSQSRILIADWYNDCIHILDQDGQFLRYIDQCDLQQPHGLCVDSRDNLFVAQRQIGTVKKIKYY